LCQNIIENITKGGDNRAFIIYLPQQKMRSSNYPIAVKALKDAEKEQI